MADLAGALQRAVFSALRDSDTMLAAFGSERPRVFDSIPQPEPNETEAAYRKRVRMPYVTIGDDQIIDDSTTCEKAWEVFVTVHVWSRAVGRIEAKSIGSAIEETLDTTLTIDGFVVKEHELRDARYPIDPDGVTTHGIIVLRYLIDPA